MLQQAILLLMLSLCIICVKTTIMFTTIHYIYEIPVRDASIIAIGLSQVRVLQKYPCFIDQDLGERIRHGPGIKSIQSRYFGTASVFYSGWRELS